MKSSDPSTRSCSCTSCFCESNSAHLKHMLLQDTRRGNLNLDKYTPLLGKQFVGMSVRTRAVINEIEYKFISKNKMSHDSAQGGLDLTKNNGDDPNKSEEKSTISNISQLPNKKCAGQSLINNCCSCCSCGCNKRQYVCKCCSFDHNQRRQVHSPSQQTGAFALDYGALAPRLQQDRNVSRQTNCKVEPVENFVNLKTKQIQSDPCSYILESMGLQKPVPEGAVQKRRIKQRQEHCDQNTDTRSRKIRQAYRGMATGMGESVKKSAAKVTENIRNTGVNGKGLQGTIIEHEKKQAQKTRLNPDVTRISELSGTPNNANFNLKNCYAKYMGALSQINARHSTCDDCDFCELTTRESFEKGNKFLRKNRIRAQGDAIIDFNLKKRKYDSSITAGTIVQAPEKLALVVATKLQDDQREDRTISADEGNEEKLNNSVQLKVNKPDSIICTWDRGPSPAVTANNSSTSSSSSLRPKSSLTESSSSTTATRKHSQKRTKDRHHQKHKQSHRKQLPPNVAKQRPILKNLQRLSPGWQTIKRCSPFNLLNDMYENKPVPNMGRGDRRKVRRKNKTPGASHRSEKEVRSGGYDLKRCFCTLKLKSKSTKTRMNKAHLHLINKLVTKSLQTMKSKLPLTQHDVMMHNDRITRVQEECIPKECELKSKERYYKPYYFLTKANYSNHHSKSSPDIKIKNPFIDVTGLTYHGPKLDTKHNTNCNDIFETAKVNLPNQQVTCIVSTSNINRGLSERDFADTAKTTTDIDVHVCHNLSKQKNKCKSKYRKQQNREAREMRISTPIFKREKSKHLFKLPRHNLRLCVCALELGEKKYNQHISGTFPKRFLTYSRSLPATGVKTLIDDETTKKWGGHRSTASLQLYECNSGISITGKCNQCEIQKVTNSFNRTISALQTTETQNSITISSCVNAEKPRIISTKEARSASSTRHVRHRKSKLSLNISNIKLTSTFSFDMAYSENKDKNKYNKQKILEPDTYQPLKLMKSSQIRQSIEGSIFRSPFIKVSEIQSILKQRKYTLKQFPQKNKIFKSFASKTRPVETIVMPAQLFHNSINLPKYMINRELRLKKVSNDLPESSAARNFSKEISLMNKISISNNMLNKLQKQPFLKKYYYAMNVQVKHRGYKLEPYECEPGVCIPGQCDPYECQKRILKRLMRKASTMTAADNNRSTAVETGGYPNRSTKKQQYKQYESKPKSLSEYHKEESAPRKQRKSDGGWDYETSPKGNEAYETSDRNRQQAAVRIGSSFSFNVSFSKEGSPDKNSKRKANGIAAKHKTSSRLVKRNSVVSTKTMPYHKQQKAKGTKNHRHGRDIESQSVTRMHDKGSFITPKHERCFCTLRFQKKGLQQKHADKQTKENEEWSKKGKKKDKKEVQTTNTGQNTSKRYNEIDISHLAPYECEPNVCIPGQCDPYECLERIKRRNKYTKDFGTEAYLQQSTGTGTNKVHKSPDANTMTLYALGDSQQSSSTSMITNNNQMKGHSGPRTTQGQHGQPAAGPSKQVVRIGSNFSFNIEFYKDKSPGRPNNLNEHNKRSKDIGKTLTRTSETEIDPLFYAENKNIVTNSKEIEVNNFSSMEKPKTKNQKAGVGPRLKRCFCTLALHKEIYEGKKLKQAISKSQINTVTKGTKAQPVKITPTHKEAYNKARPYKLEPYECEPGICIPGKCDPYQCAKLIKKRLLQESGTVTESFRGRTAFTETGKHIKLKNRKGQINTAVSAEQVLVHSPIDNRQMHRGDPVSATHSQEDIGYQRQHSKRQREIHGDRQVVRIGSNFSFNVEFYKTRTPSKRHPDDVSVHRTANGDVEDYGRRRIDSISSGTKAHGTDGLRVELRSHGTDGRPMESKAYGTYDRKMESKGSGGSSLKRCFCTLTLQKGGTKLLKQQQNIQPDSKAKQKDKHVGTKKGQIDYDNTLYKETGTKTKKNKPFYNLEPYECEPGTCVPGQCDPLECYERIKKRELRTLGTGTKRYPGKTMRNMTEELMVDEQTHMIIAYGSKPSQAHGDAETAAARPCEDSPGQSHDHATGENISNPPDSKSKQQRQVCRIGSNFNVNIEFYKNKTAAEVSQSHVQKRIAKSEPRSNGHYASSFQDRNGDLNHNVRNGRGRYTSRSQDQNENTNTSKGRAQHTKMKKNAKNTEIQAKQFTENKGTTPGKALKRCFCTAKLFQSGDNTRHNMYTVGRVDRIRTIDPFNWLSHSRCQHENVSCGCLYRTMRTNEHRCTKYHKQYLNTPVQITKKKKHNRKKSQIKEVKGKAPLELTIVYLNKNTGKGKRGDLTERDKLQVSGWVESKCQKPRDAQCNERTRNREKFIEVVHSNNVETIQLYIAKKFKNSKRSIHKSYRNKI